MSGQAALGGAHFPEPLTTPDPQGLTRAYAALFVEARRADGDGRRADASSRAAGGWMVDDRYRPPRRPRRGDRARRVVGRARRARSAFACRSSSSAAITCITSRAGTRGSNRPVLDLEKGYVVTPMAPGLRLTTGAEFARLDDPPSSAHLDRLEPFAQRNVSARGAQGGEALARPPPLPARHAPGDRAVPRQGRACGSTSPTTTSA